MVRLGSRDEVAFVSGNEPAAAAAAELLLLQRITRYCQLTCPCPLPPSLMRAAISGTAAVTAADAAVASSFHCCRSC